MRENIYVVWMGWRERNTKFENPICPECNKANSLKKLLTNIKKYIKKHGK